MLALLMCVTDAEWWQTWIDNIWSTKLKL